MVRGSFFTQVRRAARVVAVGALLASCGGRHATTGTDAGGGGTGGLGGNMSLGSGGGGMSSAAGAAGASGSMGTGGVSGSTGGDGTPLDGGGIDGPDGGFASDFAARARPALAAVAPSGNCDTALPTVPATDAGAAREAIRQYVAQVVGLSPADLRITAQTCGTPASAKCSAIFGHDAAKSGGMTYATISSLGEELEANATDIEVTLWIPADLGSAVAVVMSGISDGQLVGMVIFEGAYPCQ